MCKEGEKRLPGKQSSTANLFTHTQASTHMGNGKSFDTHKGQPQPQKKKE
jgi:hypothetical protein